MNRYQTPWVAGAFIQEKDTGATNSLNSTNVSSHLIGSSAWRGIATVLSGTSVASVAAAAARSGAVIILTPYMYANATASGGALQAAPCVGSVSAGAFMILNAGGTITFNDMPVAWQIVR